MGNSKDLQAIDTIAALSTPEGRAALAVIRISGLNALAELQRLSGASFKAVPRQLMKLTLKQAGGSRVLDECLAVYFQAPHSFTGEDVVELYTHGNPEIVKQILAEIVSHETRLAEPGEFSRRAFFNKKLSLAELESLKAIIEAPDFETASQALSLKLGGLGLSVKALKSKVTALRAEIESRLDFPDYEVSDAEHESLSSRLESLIEELSSWIRAFRSNRKWVEGVSVVIAGPPNSGKSSIFNALVGSDRSIVFDEPGTTRDQVEAELQFRGKRINVIDTAGVHETEHPIELLGIEKTHRLLESADLILWVSEAMRIGPGELIGQMPEKKWLLIASKADIALPKQDCDLVYSYSDPSALKALEDLIARNLPELEASKLMLSSERQCQHIQSAIGCLKESKNRLESSEFLEWSAEPLKKAVENLELVVGELPHQAMLDSVLENFCIGK